MKRLLLLVMSFTMVLALVAMLVVPAPIPAQADPDPGWYNLSWGYRKAITFTSDSGKIPSTQSYFPVLISLTDTDLKADARNDGYDILFTSSNGTTKLDHEIEKFDGSTGELVAWVEVPSLSTGALIYMYYGNSGATDQQNVTGTWDSNYKAVWHLSEDPSGTAPQILDSTSNNNAGTSQGSMSNLDLITAKIGYGLDLDGTDDYIRVPHSTSLDITGNQITLEAWVRMPIPNPSDSPFIVKGPSINQERYMIGVDGGVDPGKINHRVTTSGGHFRYDTGTIANETWTYTVVVYDGSLGSDPRFFAYKDGSLVSSNGANGDILTTTEPVQLGKRVTGDNRWYKGVFDELRISDTARSADYISTCYYNQDSPSTFYSIGAEESAPDAPTALGPAQYVDGSWGNDNTPTLQFSQSDPDPADTVKYRIQIDDSADFSSPVVDYTSALLVQGATTFTMGQAAGGGSYVAGGEGQTLTDGSYYWQVMSTDNQGAASGWTTANGGAIAFKVDTTLPTMEAIAEGEGQYYNAAPSFSNFGFDDNVALDDGWYQIDSFAGAWIALFTDVADTSWDSDGWTILGFAGLIEGTHTIYFKASDDAGNVEGEAGEWSWQFYKDTTPPTDPTNVQSTSHTISTWSTDNTVDVTWTDATDTGSGLDGYATLWDTISNTIPPATKDIEEGIEATTSPALTDGNSHYFHIQSVDNLGNWQSTVHLGPFFIDTTPPSGGVVGGAPRDTMAPIMSNISASSITEISADISWRTNEASTSQVEYRTSPSKLSSLDETMVRDHHVRLIGLTPGTTYHYRAMSRDAAGNLAVSDKDTFTTLGEAPAAIFASSDLSISPTEVNIGQTVTISILVVNSGDLTGSYEVTLKINAAVEATQYVTVGAGASETVTFTTSRDVAGSYSVDVNGLSGSFTVKKKPVPAPPPPPPAPPEVKPINWPLVGGIIAAVVVVGLLVFFLVIRRRAAL